MALISSENSNQGLSYTAFFDLDQTLINANSGKILIQLAYKKNMMKWPDIVRVLWFSFLYKSNLRQAENIVYDMVSLVAGVPVKTLKDLSYEMVKNRFINVIPIDARMELSFHREQSAKTVILSSSLSPICKAVAEHLQMDDIICTDPEVKNGFLTGHTNNPVCYGKEKLLRLKKYCEINNTTPEASWYYGDSVSDFPVLEKVGHPVCINPDKKLKQIAVTNGWPVKYWY